MNKNTLEGDWKKLRGKAKEKWGVLTDDDLDQIDGRRDQLEGTLQKRYGIAQDEAQRQVDSFKRDCGC